MILDLEAIIAGWLKQCACCDAGLPGGCTCPTGDPRSDIAALIAEVERLRDDLARVVAAKGADWESGYATGCEMSHSVGCDAMKGERDQLRAALAEERAARAAVAAPQKPYVPHPALLMPVPKWHLCVACSHSVNGHRESGCDVYPCECHAPYGRVMPGDPAPTGGSDG